MGGFTVTLGGQDITAYVDPLSLALESVLGQGAGALQGTSGRSTTASFITSLGPAASAYGAGQPLPPGAASTNLLTANQSDVETDTSGFSTANSSLLTGNVQATISRDTSKSWHGAASLHMNSGAVTTGSSGVEIVPGVSIPAGSQVTISFYYQSLLGGGALRVHDYTNGGGPAGVTITSPQASWTRLTYTFTQTAATSDLRFAIRTSTQNQDYWIDGLQIEIGSSASNWTLGGTTSGTPVLQRQAEVIVYDSTNNNRMFGGYVSKLSDLTMRKQPMVQIDCHDYWQDLDRVQCNLVFDNVSDTSIISQVLSTYAPWIDTSLVDLTVSNYTFQLRRFRAKSVMQILQTVADVVGFDVWVDAYRRLHYQSPSSLGTAAFSISDTPDGINSFGAQFSKYEVDDNAIINRVYFYGGKKASTDFTQDLSSQANGSNTLFVVAYYPRNASDGKVHVTKNGVDLAVGAAFGSGAANTLKSQGGTADCILNVDAQTIQFDVAPATGNTVTCKYRYNIPLLVTLSNQQSQSYYGRWYDGNIVDDAVYDTQTAIQRCRILLAEQAYGLTEMTFTTRQPGLVAGTQISVVNQARGINGTFMIQKVTTRPIGGGYYDFEVECGAWNWQLADLLLSAARALTPQDDTTNESTTPIQAQEVAVNIGVHTVVTTTTTTTGNYVYGTGKYGFATYH